MDETEFRNRYIGEIPVFRSWGYFVQDSIFNILKDRVKNIDLFLKIPLGKPRIKEVDSLIAKAFHRGKDYTSPYEDITDKVGVRFVVLLTTDIDIIKKIIEDQDGVLWKASKDRDFEDEREKSPELFTYESVHYVVYNITQVEYRNEKISPNTPCEIQIRTLLQHAYAEMSHDTTYKSQVKADSQVKRCMARSMALVESADHFFLEAMEKIAEKSSEHEKWAEFCIQYYPLEYREKFDPNANTFLIDQLLPMLSNVEFEEVKDFLQQKQSEFEILITRNYNLSWIYRQPAVLLVYYLIERKNATLQRGWPLVDSLLQPLLSDRGFSPLHSTYT
ncbi:MAG: RelA/SpoT domain-containing protein [Veillonellales bacterium]